MNFEYDDVFFSVLWNICLYKDHFDSSRCLFLFFKQTLPHQNTNRIETDYLYSQRQILKGNVTHW